MPVNRPNWALVLVGEAGYIEGATRVQKYAFLGAQTIKGLEDRGFYSDWVASKYGPFSRDLANDIDVLLSRGDLGRYEVKNEFGYPVDRFALTTQGQGAFEGIQPEAQPYADKLKQIVVKYNGKTLMQVLHDVYYQFPQYAVASLIRPEVERRSFESDSYLNPEYDEPSA